MRKPKVGTMIEYGVIVAMVVAAWLFIRSTPEYTALNCTFQPESGDKVADATKQFDCITQALINRPGALTVFSDVLNDLVSTIDEAYADSLAKAEAADIPSDRQLDDLDRLERLAQRMRDIYGPLLVEAHQSGLALTLIVSLKEMQLRQHGSFF